MYYPQPEADQHPGPPRRRIAAATCTPLAFGVQQAYISYMTPGVKKHKPTAGALRAAAQLQPDSSLIESAAELIDRETGLRHLMDIFETIIAEAGDLIERRSPELVAEARAALRRFNDGELRQAE